MVDEAGAWCDGRNILMSVSHLITDAGFIRQRLLLAIRLPQPRQLSPASRVKDGLNAILAVVSDAPYQRPRVAAHSGNPQGKPLAPSPAELGSVAPAVLIFMFGLPHHLKPIYSSPLSGRRSGPLYHQSTTGLVIVASVSRAPNDHA